MNDLWEPCHITIGFFEIAKTFGNVNLNEIFAKLELNVQVITYVKDEGGNISTMTQVLIYIISCEGLGLAQPFVGSCWGLAMSKFC